MATYLIGILISWSVALLGLWVNPVPEVWIAYGFVNPLLFSIPRLMFFLPAVRRRVTTEWVRTLELVGIAIIIVNAPGSLVLHDLAIQYDRFLHFAVGFLALPLTVSIIAAIRGADVDAKRSKTFWISALIVFIGLFAFEGVQYSSDRLFGTQLFFDGAQPIEVDFVEDIIFGTIGLLLAASVFVRSDRAWRRYTFDLLRHQLA